MIVIVLCGFNKILYLIRITVPQNVPCYKDVGMSLLNGKQINNRWTNEVIRGD